MNHQKRIVAIYIFLAFMMAMCLFSVYRVSVSEKAKLALSGQYTRSLTVAERRGIIYDRNKNPLNAKISGYICLVNPAEISDAGEMSKKIALASEIPESAIVEKFLDRVPFTLKIANPDVISDFPGIHCFPVYESGIDCAVHLVGYTDLEGKGVTGAEKLYNGYLSGALSGKVTYKYSADAAGRPLFESGSLLYDDSYSEESGVVLTIDSILQNFCEKSASYNIESGAVVVLDIESGEILSLVSLPFYDSKNIAQYLDSSKGELLNRCTLSFTPGSIFKTVVAAASLSKNPDNFNIYYECKGFYEFPDGTKFSCHNKNGHGTLTMKEAYAQSCNPYFINLALLTGTEKIADTSKKMGLSEIAENLMQQKGKTKSQSEEGFLANIAIGQGPLLITPTDAAAMFACAATGYYSTPSSFSHIFRNNSIIERNEIKRSRVLSENVCEKLREMMVSCVEDGLGASAKPQGADAGGKTATAQTGRFKDGREIFNSWFCGVYPISQPKYAIAVLCDVNSRKNNVKAVFKQICEFIYSGESDYPYNP